MNLGKLIGKGATAEVFEYESNKVIKLYNAGETGASIKYEFEKLKYAHNNHVPCPEVFEITEVDERLGYTMEKYHGVTVKDKLFQEIQKVVANEMAIELFSNSFFNDIKGTAKALYEVHKVKITDWEKINDKLIWEVQSTELLIKDEKKLIINLIEDLPEDTAVCHGDPNPNNVIFYEGEYKLIDWVNAGIGNTMYDIAEYVWLNTPHAEMNFEGVPRALIDFYLINKDLIIPTFINEYVKLSGKDLSSYEAYIIPLLARKLHSNRTAKEKSRIVLEIRDRLSKLF